MMTLAYWFTQQEHDGFPVENVELSTVDRAARAYREHLCCLSCTKTNKAARNTISERCSPTSDPPVVENAAYSCIDNIGVLAWYPRFLNPPEKLWHIPNVSYGEVERISPNEMVIRVKGDLGSLVSKLGPDWKAIAIAVHYTGELDSADTQGLQKSAPHDVHDGIQTFLIHPDEKFLDELNKGQKGTRLTMGLSSCQSR